MRDVDLVKTHASQHHHHTRTNTGFYWIPTLAGPTSLDNRGIEWLWPLVDGHPPIGWEAAGPYLVLPALLITCQYISSSIISPPIDPNAENANTQRALYTFLPLMVGYFALNVPSGGFWFVGCLLLHSCLCACGKNSSVQA